MTVGELYAHLAEMLKNDPTIEEVVAVRDYDDSWINTNPPELLEARGDYQDYRFKVGDTWGGNGPEAKEYARVVAI